MYRSAKVNHSILYQITIHYTSLKTVSIAHRWENFTVVIFVPRFAFIIKSNRATTDLVDSDDLLTTDKHQIGEEVFCWLFTVIIINNIDCVINGAQVTYIANTIEFLLRFARCRQRCTRLFHESPKIQTCLNIIDSPGFDKSAQGYSTSHVHYRTD